MKTKSAPKTSVASEMRYEIFPSGVGWRWRFVDGLQVVGGISPLLSREQCVKRIDTLRTTLRAPIFVL